MTTHRILNPSEVDQGIREVAQDRARQHVIGSATDWNEHRWDDVTKIVTRDMEPPILDEYDRRCKFPLMELPDLVTRNQVGLASRCAYLRIATASQPIETWLMSGWIFRRRHLRWDFLMRLE